MKRSWSHRGDAARLVARRRLHPRQDRPQQDGRDPPRRERALGPVLRVPDDRHRVRRWRGAGSGCSSPATCASRCRGSRARTSSRTPWGQVLPTSVGGDASRIFETSRRHPGQITPVTGSVLLERALGGAVTLALAGVGFLLAIGRYPIGAYLWLEVALRRRHGRRGRRLLLAHGAPPARVRRAARAQAAARAAGARRLRRDPRLPRPRRPLLVVVAVTVLLQLVADPRDLRVAAAPVGIHLSVLPYIVLGAAALPRHARAVHVNGLGVREAFFVSFLGNLGVSPDAAFACGFLFFLMTVLLAAARSRDHPLGERLRPAHAGARAQCLTVTVVVVTWNALPWLEQCLESVRGQRRDRRRPRLDRRDTRVRARPLPECPRARTGEPRHGRAATTPACARPEGATSSSSTPTRGCPATGCSG